MQVAFGNFEIRRAKAIGRHQVQTVAQRAQQQAVVGRLPPQINTERAAIIGGDVGKIDRQYIATLPPTTQGWMGLKIRNDALIPLLQAIHRRPGLRLGKQLQTGDGGGAGNRVSAKTAAVGKSPVPIVGIKHRKHRIAGHRQTQRQNPTAKPL